MRRSLYFVSILLYDLLFLQLFYVLYGFQGRFLDLWHWVVSVSSPWMATQDSSHCQIETLEHSMLAEGLKCVLRASGSESAACWLERGNADLIESYQEYEGRDRDLLQSLRELTHLR